MLEHQSPADFPRRDDSRENAPLHHPYRNRDKTFLLTK